MSEASFQRLDGLMDLAKREGIDVRPTLLRVLTDLYVQAENHTANEERQFTELFHRLIAVADDATVAAVRARLVVFPGTPPAVLRRLATLPWKMIAAPRRHGPPHAVPAETAKPARADHAAVIAEAPLAPADVPADVETRFEAAIAATTPTLSPQERRSQDARIVTDRFFEGNSSLREKVLDNLEHSAFTPVAPPDERRAARACDSLERAAFAHNQSAFAMELASALLLPVATAQRIVRDRGGEAMVCAVKALGMPLEVFQRVLIFLDPGVGQSVHEVYRRSHLFTALSDRAALTMLSIWRMAAIPAGKDRLGIGKYRSSLHDDERQRARPGSAAPAQRPDAQQPAATTERIRR